jgi:luciferase family oxidoreductase group 1
MLPNHSPLKVAESFRVLAALHPDRVDLGVGRAAGTDTGTALALRQSRELLGAERFPEQLEQLLAFLRSDPDPAARFGPIKAVLTGVAAPPVFVLGSGGDGASIAAKLGLAFALAHQLSPDGAAPATKRYRDEFTPARSSQSSPGIDAPYTIVSASVICGASDEEAEELARPSDVSGVRFGQGIRDMPFPSVDEAREYAFDADEEANPPREPREARRRRAEARRRRAPRDREGRGRGRAHPHDDDPRSRRAEAVVRAARARAARLSLDAFTTRRARPRGAAPSCRRRAARGRCRPSSGSSPSS